MSEPIACPADHPNDCDYDSECQGEAIKCCQGGCGYFTCMAAEAAEAVGVTESIEKEPETTAGETTSTEEIPQEV